jgi:hypothetical protein
MTKYLPQDVIKHIMSFFHPKIHEIDLEEYYEKNNNRLFKLGKKLLYEDECAVYTIRNQLSKYTLVPIHEIDRSRTKIDIEIVELGNIKVQLVSYRGKTVDKKWVEGTFIESILTDVKVNYRLSKKSDICYCESGNDKAILILNYKIWLLGYKNYILRIKWNI